MPIDWSPFVEFVHQHQRFLLTTHIRPDGDGLGSMIGLADTLQRLDKGCRMVVASKKPPRYDFLDPQQCIQEFHEATEADRQAEAVIILDTGTWNQLGSFGLYLKTLDCPRLVIDHHLTQDDLRGLRLVDTSAEATGRLVYEAIQALGLSPSERAAQALLVALAMDTGWFRHNNTSPATFTLASELTRQGARPAELYDLLFEQNTLGKLKLTGLILDRLQTSTDGRVAWSELHRGDYEATGATPQDTEDLVNYTRSVRGVEVGLFFMEQPRGGVKVSFRSRSRVDVARLAEKFGGGGHRLASGAILELPLEQARQKVLAEVRAALASLD